MLAGFVCYFACGIIKKRLGIDDALDVFAVHGVGGIMGSLLLAVFGTSAFGGFGVENTGAQLLLQIKGVGFTLIWSAAGTLIIIAIVKATVGLRIENDVEHVGSTKQNMAKPLTTSNNLSPFPFDGKCQSDHQTVQTRRSP